MTELSYEILRDAVGGAHVALRSRLRLEPAGGAGDKVFPPTYGVADRAEHKYATERRTVGDEVWETVLLDSVASQANRMEMALLEGLEMGELSFPNPFVDFSNEAGLEDLDRISSLQAPHRLADAIFRDSMYEGTLFRLSPLGQAITDARPGSAAALLNASPAALLFGMWDSTGPKGGLGSKFQRALVSEIVGFGTSIGKKVGSRIDPLQVGSGAGPLYEHIDPQQVWTLDPNEAARDDKGKNALALARGGKSDAGRPSKANHGNIVPSIDTSSGGVTISYATQTTVLSFAALRRLRFPTDASGTAIPPGLRRDAELAARTAVAALGAAAIAYQVEQDFDLRSRCLLVPSEPLNLELLTRDGSAPIGCGLSTDSAAQILARAATELERVGLGWATEEIRLIPAPKLSDLVRRSREQAAVEPTAVD
jgi:CRISPR-associated protein Csb1